MEWWMWAVAAVIGLPLGVVGAHYAHKLTRWLERKLFHHPSEREEAQP